MDEETTNSVKNVKITLGGFLTFLYWVIGFCLLGAFIFWLSCVNYIKQYEFPYSFDKFTGEVKKLEHTGYIVTNPWTSVYGIDLRPHQVMIEVGKGNEDSANKRILNAKLVSFIPSGLDDFIKLHGPQDGDVSEILKIYAYDQEGKTFPFLKVETQSVSSYTNNGFSQGRLSY